MNCSNLTRALRPAWRTSRTTCTTVTCSVLNPKIRITACTRCGCACGNRECRATTCWQEIDTGRKHLKKIAEEPGCTGDAGTQGLSGARGVGQENSPAEDGVDGNQD